MFAEPNRCPICGAEQLANTPEGLCSRCQTPPEMTDNASSAAAVDAPAAPATTEFGHSPAPAEPHTTAAATGEWTPDPNDSTRTADRQPATDDLARGTVVRYFGDYEIQKELGRGGMGVVYKARQVSLNRSVALKMIKAGVLADDAELRRFQNEAEAVAVLDHAGIVPVYEVGEHDGQRYFSMKLVEGGSLADELASFKNNLKAAATLLAETAEAIHHAHMRGILHRDLKPANILVDSEAHPHVTDFGLAKMIESDVELTQSGAIMGTPAYMSPEQAGGRRGTITTATDVYGLGAILYALLTGEAPFGGESLIETLDAVRTRPPEPPRKRSASTPRDLETICLKCLEKDPRRRYASAQALADDLHAWLNLRPISARRVGTTERAWLWCKRKPVVAALAASVLLAALLGTGAVIAVQTKANRVLEQKNLALQASNTKLDEQRVRAEARETQAINAVKHFGDAVSKNEALKSNPMLESLRKELLKEPLTFFKDLRDRLLTDKDTRSESLARLADASFDLGRLTNEIGNQQDAVIAYRESLAIRQKLADSNPAVARFRGALAGTHHNLAVLVSAMDKPAEAEAAYRKAIALSRKLADDNPADTQSREFLPNHHGNLGTLLSATGRPAEAEAELHQAIALRQKLADDNPAVSELRSTLAGSHHNLGDVLRATGTPAGAEAEYRKAIALSRKVTDENPTVPEYRLFLGNHHHNLGALLFETGKLVEAEAELREALALRQKLADDNPAITEFRRALANSYNTLGMLLSATGKLVKAEAEHRKALLLSQKLADDNPAVSDFRMELAGGHHGLGVLLSRMGKAAGAEAEYRKAIALSQKLTDDNPAGTKSRVFLANHHDSLGNLLSATGRPAEAEAELRQAISLRQKLADENPAVSEYCVRLAASHHDLAALLSKTGTKLAEAEAGFRQAITLRQKLADGEPERDRAPPGSRRRESRPRRSRRTSRSWRSCENWWRSTPSRWISRASWADASVTLGGSTWEQKEWRRPASSSERPSSGSGRPWTRIPRIRNTGSSCSTTSMGWA